MTAWNESAGGKRAKAILKSRPFLTVAIVAAVWIGASFASRGFGAYGHLRYLVELGAVIGLVAAGQTFVVIAGGIDLSVAAIVTVSAISLPLLSWQADPTGLAPVLAVLALTTVIGLVNGLGVALLRVHPMIMTLAMATFLQGLLIIIAGGSAVTAENPLVHWLGNARPAGIPAGILLWVAVSAIVLTVMHATPFGARIFAMGANPLAAALSGVPVTSTTLAVYGISGFTAGLAGVLVLGMNGQGYVGIGDPYLLASIAAVVLGGTSILGGLGTYAGTIPGAILLVTITALITVVNASPGWRSILFGSLILGLLLLSGREQARR
ncbi:MAG: ABC transporter permease [Mesorhizobium sp.]|uniref:ABC transporter permease n=3 Tax=Mesorhizobium TaxID=68287 RepID=UPI000F759A68|nr:MULTISPECIES: ABC transporter permease [unclassified Mesorhizobium]RVD68273.1 ABC transporter permease [Mesorhizobium sp. M4A.F.Ca.ET.029.04.2.1]AZO51648.1 ABC transporter permease [Mesorhizobium sp. M4B.F.Ca.ET.058.02.1.1]RUX48869.1 ABC transporter permease [Mesorhizobium sp. M4A.F.Ca.ET.050.02.1.1]RVC46859.1 ABC transporter permease [Mesorhizobium sp. M4A.F.Ca.ET.090.04.2.1]RWC19729.1 MAG: ABC transporter permease [Mesorhizobium sp.]